MVFALRRSLLLTKNLDLLQWSEGNIESRLVSPINYVPVPLTCPRSAANSFLLFSYRTIYNENLLFRPISSHNTSPLNKENLPRLTYALSFQYGTATKSPRLPAVLQYSARLAMTALGYLDSLFSNERDPFQPTLEDEDDVYRKATGDSRVFPWFNPFFEDEGTAMPFHPHLSA